MKAAIKAVLWRLEVAVVGGVILLGYGQMIHGAFKWLTNLL